VPRAHECKQSWQVQFVVCSSQIKKAGSIIITTVH
jgi:hypothetical protein